MIQTFLRNLLFQLPAVAVAVVGVTLLARGKNYEPRPRLFGLIGFCLILGQAMLLPVGQMLLSKYFESMPVANSATTAQIITNAYTLLGLIWSIVRGAAYLFLLIALITSLRPKSYGPTA